MTIENNQLEYIKSKPYTLGYAILMQAIWGSMLVCFSYFFHYGNEEQADAVNPQISDCYVPGKHGVMNDMVDYYNNLCLGGIIVSCANVIIPFFYCCHILKDLEKFSHGFVLFGSLMFLIACTNRRFNDNYGEYCLNNVDTPQKDSVQRVSEFFARFTVLFWIILPMQLFAFIAVHKYDYDLQYGVKSFKKPLLYDEFGHERKLAPVKVQKQVLPSPRYGGSMRPPFDGNPRVVGLAYAPGTPRDQMNEDRHAYKPSGPQNYDSPLLELPVKQEILYGIQEQDEKVVESLAVVDIENQGGLNVLEEKEIQQEQVLFVEEEDVAVEEAEVEAIVETEEVVVVEEEAEQEEAAIEEEAIEEAAIEEAEEAAIEENLEEPLLDNVEQPADDY